MFTFTIDTKKASLIAKALLPILKHAEKMYLPALTEVSVTDGHLYASDRYIALKIPLNQLLKSYDNEDLTGYRISLAQVEALAKIKATSLAASIVTKTEDKTFTIEPDVTTKIGYYGDYPDIPSLPKLFPEKADTEELGDYLGFSSLVFNNITKIVSALKATSVSFGNPIKDNDKKIRTLKITGDVDLEVIVASTIKGN